EMPRNGATGYFYRGINVFLTTMRGFSSPYWYSAKQIRAKKGNIIKGEKATMVIYFNVVESENDFGETKKFPVLRYYNVFNLEQTEGISEPENEFESFTEIRSAEEIIENSRIKIPIQRGSPCYNPALDIIKMPARESFERPEEIGRAHV